MGAFSNIDSLLEQFAQKQNAKLTRNRDGMSLDIFKFEERRIDWIRNGINRAVIIQPEFTSSGVDRNKWRLLNVAWKGTGYKKIVTEQILTAGVDFNEIEKDIEEWLAKSDTYLNGIEQKDLKPLNKKY